MGQVLARRTRYHETTLDAQEGGETTELALISAQAEYLADLYLPVAGRADQIRNLGLRTMNLFNWLRARVNGCRRLGGNVMRWIPVPAGLSSFWSFDPGTTAFYIKQAAVSISTLVLEVPHIMPGLYISNLVLTVSSPVSHSGSLPATMPRVYLMTMNGDGTATEIAQGDDTSASAAAYEAVHTITVTFSRAVLTTDCLHIVVQGENSTNSQANSFRIFRLAMNVDYEP